LILQGYGTRGHPGARFWAKVFSRAGGTPAFPGRGGTVPVAVLPAGPGFQGGAVGRGPTTGARNQKGCCFSLGRWPGPRGSGEKVGFHREGRGGGRGGGTPLPRGGAAAKRLFFPLPQLVGAPSSGPPGPFAGVAGGRRFRGDRRAPAACDDLGEVEAGGRVAEHAGGPPAGLWGISGAPVRGHVHVFGGPAFQRLVGGPRAMKHVFVGDGAQRHHGSPHATWAGAFCVGGEKGDAAIGTWLPSLLLPGAPRSGGMPQPNHVRGQPLGPLLPTNVGGQPGRVGGDLGPGLRIFAGSGGTGAPSKTLAEYLPFSQGPSFSSGFRTAARPKGRRCFFHLEAGMPESIVPFRGGAKRKKDPGRENLLAVKTKTGVGLDGGLKSGLPRFGFFRGGCRFLRKNLRGAAEVSPIRGFPGFFQLQFRHPGEERSYQGPRSSRIRMLFRKKGLPFPGLKGLGAPRSYRKEGPRAGKRRLFPVSVGPGGGGTAFWPTGTWCPVSPGRGGKRGH